MQLTGWNVAPRSVEVSEGRLPGELPQAMTNRLAMKKAKAMPAGSGLVLAADTIVVDGDTVLGKPRDAAQAREMLESLRGRDHQVMTSIALVDQATGSEFGDTCVSTVNMRDYDSIELEAYLDEGSPLDKAGSYGIQDGEMVRLEDMRDCFANVMGLPLCHVVRSMRRLGYEPPRDVPEACQAHVNYDCPVYAKILEGSL